MADYTIEVAVPNVGPQGPQGPAGEFGELEAPEDGIIYGRKDAEWVDMTSPANLQVRRGTAAEVAAITPLEGEPVWATDTKVLRVGDGSSAGGVVVGGFAGGAFASGQTPGSVRAADNTNASGGSSVAGDARGVGSVDLQMNRTAANMVASGPYSLVAGRNSRASGQNAIAIGADSTALGVSATAIQGGTVSALVTKGVAIGSATADRNYMMAYGIFTSTPRRFQAVQIGFSATTTNATPTEMVISFFTKFNIPLDVAVFGTIEIAAIEVTNATESAHFVRKFAIQNLGGTTSLIGSVTTIGTDHKSDAAYDVTITADNTGDFLKVAVTGDSSKTLRWIGFLSGVETAIAE